MKCFYVKNKYRWIICSVLCFFFIFSLSACGNTKTDGGNNDSRVLPTTYVLNNLSYEYEDEENKTGLIEISGLKDKTVEEKINKRISEKYYEVKDSDVPNYRGIKAKFGENPELDDDEYSETIDVYVGGNYNNIFSVVISKSVLLKTLKNPEDSEFVTWKEPLNFDLNTGEEIALKDIFYDDADGMPDLNYYIYDIIIKDNMQEEFSNSEMSVGNELTLIGKYNGIDENQKFYFSYSPKIALVFDYETSEYYTGYNGFQSIDFEIPLTPDMAILDKWYDEDSTIFDSKEPVSKALIEDSYDNYENNLEKIYLADGDSENQNYFVSVSTSYPKDISESMKKNMTKGYDLDIDSLKREMKPYADRLINKYGIDDAYCSGEKNLNIRRFGKYYNSIYSEFRYAVCNSDESEYLNDSNYYCDVYREGSDKPLKIRDIFAENCDYREVLIDCFCKELNQTIIDCNEDNSDDYNFGFGKNAEKDREYAGILVDNITSFQLQDQYLDLEFGDLKQSSEILKKVYGDELKDLPMSENDYFFASMIFYKDIGAENLAIFD